MKILDFIKRYLESNYPFVNVLGGMNPWALGGRIIFFYSYFENGEVKKVSFSVEICEENFHWEGDKMIEFALSILRDIPQRMSLDNLCSPENKK